MGNLDGTSRDREAREQLAAAVCRGCVLVVSWRMTTGGG